MERGARQYAHILDATIGYHFPHAGGSPLSPPQFVSDIEKTYIPVFLGRVSTPSQRAGLPTQMKFIEKKFNDGIGSKFKKTPLSFQVQQSGREGEQKTLEILRTLVEDNPKKKYVAVFRNLDRMARDAEGGLATIRQMSALGVPVIALNMSTLLGKKPLGDRSADLLMLVQLGIADFGRQGVQDAQQAGATKAAEVGLVGGTPLSIDSDKAITRKGRLLTPWRRIWEAKEPIANGDMTMRGLTTAMGYVVEAGANKGDPNTSKPRKIRDFLNALVRDGGEKAVLEYLDVIDELTRVEKKYGDLATAKRKASRRQSAVSRVSRGYRLEPLRFPNPVKDGNPAIAEFLGTGPAIGTIADAVKDPRPYLATK